MSYFNILSSMFDAADTKDENRIFNLLSSDDFNVLNKDQQNDLRAIAQHLLKRRLRKGA